MLNNYTTASSSLNISAFLSTPQIPSLISEWAATFPLVFHLANYGDDHHMVGELALARHLTVNLFPKLGFLGGISRLLQGGADFLDRANAQSASGSGKVWDVNWGSVFTPANGSAMHILTKYALRKHKEPMDMQKLSPSDRTWVLLNSQLAIQADRLIRARLSKGKPTKSL